MTGPAWIPTHSSSTGNRIFSRSAFMRATVACISSAARQVSIGCRRLAARTPATAIQASPIALSFSAGTLVKVGRKTVWQSKSVSSAAFGLSHQLRVRRIRGRSLGNRH
jgi:hypothetical protein